MKSYPIETLKIKSGVYVNTQFYMINEQKDWDDSDKAKKFNFTTHKFWITTDSGEKPIGFNDISEVKDLLEWLGY